MPGLNDDGSDSPSAPLDCGEDKELFVRTANRYVPATLRINSGGTIYRCAVDDSGLFIKRVIAVSQWEPPEIAALLHRKSLAGRYERGNFLRAWVDRLNLGLERCRGSLKDAFEYLRITPPHVIRERFRARNNMEAGLREEKTVLIVDDDSNVILLITALLKRDSDELTPLAAYDGREGLGVLFREKVDLVVLNLRMPVMDGTMVLEVMAKDAELRKIPVLMSTGTPFARSGYMGEPDPFRGMYVEWHERPFNAAALVRRIRHMLMEA